MYFSKLSFKIQFHIVCSVDQAPAPCSKLEEAGPENEVVMLKHLLDEATVGFLHHGFCCFQFGPNQIGPPYWVRANTRK